MIKTLMIYASVDGHTKKVCDYIKNKLEQNNHSVELINITNFNKDITCLDFDKIVLASSIRYGFHNKQIEALINKNYEYLNSKKTAFISVNLVARKIEKNTAETNPYVAKFLNNIKWKPSIIGVFAGSLNYAIYSFIDSMLIKLIMLITKGPTKSDKEIVYTNWDNVDKFSEELIKL